MPKEEIPKHIKDKVWADINNRIPYSHICETWGIKSKSTISNIKREYEKTNGIEPGVKPISQAEKNRRKKIGTAAVTTAALRKAEFIAEGFLNAFDVITYNANNMIEVINHSRDEADSLKTKQEEILKAYQQIIDMPEEGDGKKDKAKYDFILSIRESIQKINDFYARDNNRIKAVGELRKNLETFLKLKQEIMDMLTIKKMLDAFFTACDELDDDNYKRYKTRAIADSPVLDRLFTAYEQQKAEMGNDQHSDKQE